MSTGGKKNTTTTQASGPPSWATPYFQQNLTRAGQVAAEPYKAYTGQRVAGIGQANPYATNQYSDQMIQQLQGDITNNYQNAVAPNLMAQFQQGGAYGGSAHQQALAGSQQGLARELANASTGIRFQNADNMRNDWNQQLGRQQLLNDANYNSYLDERGHGGRQVGLMNDALRSIMGGTSSSTGPNPNYTSAGQNAAGYAAIIASMFGGG
jgi:hypothetical protein